MKIVIVGGGVAGLGAALEVLRQGHEVHLLEAGDAFGGQVRTFVPTDGSDSPDLVRRADASDAGNPAGEGSAASGEALEVFYHHLFRSDTAAIRLIEELGLGDQLQWLPTRSGMFTGGRSHDFDGALDLLRFSAVSPLGRVRLGLGALWLRRTADWHGYEGQTAASWLPRAVGTEAYRRVWLPLLRAKFGDHAEEVSLAWFWGKMYLRFASRDQGLFAQECLGYLHGSFGRLVTAMVEEIRARGGTAEHSRSVERVVIAADPAEATAARTAGTATTTGTAPTTPRVRGVVVAAAGGGAAGDGADAADRTETIEADAVILTTPAPLATRLAPELAAVRGGELARRLGSIDYQWATVLVLALDRPLSPYYWLTVTAPDCPFVLAVEQTNLVPAEQYGGRYIVYLSNYADPTDPVVSEDAAETFARYEPWLRRINPHFDRSWVRDRWLFRDRVGQPIVDAKYHERIPPLEPGIPGLYLASAAQIYPQDRGQNYAIELGERAAQLAISRGIARGPAARAAAPGGGRVE